MDTYSMHRGLLGPGGGDGEAVQRWGDEGEGGVDGDGAA